MQETVRAKQQRPGKWGMMALVLCAYVIATNFGITSFATTLPLIAADLSLNLVQIGALVSSLSLGVLCFSFISGILLDKTSVKWTMVIAVVVAAIAIFSRGIVSSFGQFYFVMFLMGMAQAVIFTGAVKIIGTWFKKEEIFIANGVLIAGAPTGLIIGNLFGYNMAMALGGWQNLFKITGGVLVIVAILWVILATDMSQKDSELNKVQQLDMEKESLGQNLKAVLSNKNAWFLCLSDFFAQGAMQTMIGLGPTIIATIPGVAANMAGIPNAFGNVASFVGYLTLPSISEKVGLRRIFIAPSFVVMGLTMMIGYSTGNFWAIAVFTALSTYTNGVTMTGSKAMMLETKGIAGIRAGTATGMLQTFSRLGAFVFPQFFTAAIIPLLGGNMLRGVMVLQVAYVIAAVFIWITAETGIGREAAKKRNAEIKAAKAAKKG